MKFERRLRDEVQVNLYGRGVIKTTLHFIRNAPDP